MTEKCPLLTHGKSLSLNSKSLASPGPEAPDAEPQIHVLYGVHEPRHGALMASPLHSQLSPEQSLGQAGLLLAVVPAPASTEHVG